MRYYLLAALSVLFSCLPLFSYTVDKDLPAGNIAVDRIEGDNVFIHQELRDTEGDWFYWAFRVTGAEGRKLSFSFTKSVAVGSRGAAVSFDRGKTWRWSDDLDRTAPRDELGDHRSWKSFDWTFGPDQHEAWFSQTIPYHPSDWESFLSRHAEDRGTVFETGVLCRTKKGRDIPYARFGRLGGKARERLFVTARHHCGEVTANFVIEGMLEAFFAKDALGVWLRENVELRVVPFVDMDGVVDGDQGKNRRPWDPARDYNDDRPQQYPQVAAIMKMLRDWKPTGVQDTHCPWLRGNWKERWNTNEYCYQPGSRLNGTKMHAYGEIVERLSAKRMGYRAADDIPYGCGWNAPKNFTQGRTINTWANETFPDSKLVTTWEIPFANQREKTLYPADFRSFGRDVIDGWREYFATN